MVEKLNEETFKEKIFAYEDKNKDWNFEGDKPAIVDFSASWCKPCKALEPILEKLSEEYKDQIDFYKVDVEDNSNIAIKFGIQAVPSLLFIPINRKPQMAQGSLPESQLKSSIDNVLLKEEEK